MTLAAQTGHVLPALKSSTLISAEQLCDEDFDFFQETSSACPKNPPAMDTFLVTQRHLLTGEKNLINKLWTTHFPRIKTNIQSNNYELTIPHPSTYTSPKKSHLLPLLRLSILLNNVQLYKLNDQAIFLHFSQ